MSLESSALVLDSQRIHGSNMSRVTSYLLKPTTSIARASEKETGSQTMMPSDEKSDGDVGIKMYSTTLDALLLVTAGVDESGIAKLCPACACMCFASPADPSYPHRHVSILLRPRNETRR
jgi:hypothetical protein